MTETALVFWAFAAIIGTFVTTYAFLQVLAGLSLRRRHRRTRRPSGMHRLPENTLSPGDRRIASRRRPKQERPYDSPARK